MPDLPYRHLRVEATASATVVAVMDKDLDHAAATAVGEELFHLVQGQLRPCLRLDLGGVERLTSTALDKFVMLRQRVLAAGGEVTLENLQPFVYEIFEVTRLTTLFHIRAHDGDEAAVRTLA